MSSQLQNPSAFRALRKDKKGLDWTALLAVAFGVFYGCCWLALRQDAPIVPKPAQQLASPEATRALNQALPPDARAWLQAHPEAQIQCASPGWGEHNAQHALAGWVLIQGAHAYPWFDDQTPCPMAEHGAVRWLGRWDAQHHTVELLSDPASARFASAASTPLPTTPLPTPATASMPSASTHTPHREDTPQKHAPLKDVPLSSATPSTLASPASEQLARAFSAGILALQQQDTVSEQLNGWKERFVQKTAQSAAARLEGEAPRSADPALQTRSSATPPSFVRP